MEDWVDWVDLLLGAGVGFLVGYILKEKISGNKSQEAVDSKQRELDELYNENEKFRRRNKEMERQIEDLQFENKKLNKKIKDNEDSKDDLTDDLDDMKRELKKLRSQNDELCSKIQEYKTACGNYEIEIERLKDKLD